MHYDPEFAAEFISVFDEFYWIGNKENYFDGFCIKAIWRKIF